MSTSPTSPAIDRTLPTRDLSHGTLVDVTSWTDGVRLARFACPGRNDLAVSYSPRTETVSLLPGSGMDPVRETGVAPDRVVAVALTLAALEHGAWLQVADLAGLLG